MRLGRSFEVKLCVAPLWSSFSCQWISISIILIILKIGLKLILKCCFQGGSVGGWESIFADYLSV